MKTTTISIDSTQAAAQIAELSQLLERIPESGRQHAVDLCSGYLDNLGSDVVLGQHVTTTGADGSIQISCSFLLGTDFERLVAALRAIEVDMTGSSHG